MTTQEAAEAKAPGYYEKAVAGTRRYLAAVGADQWDAPTPCTDWNVRQLVSHMVSGAKNVENLVAGRERESFDNVLGEDPLAAFDAATASATTAFNADGAMVRTVVSPAGEQPAANYALGQANEMLVHGWDLAKAAGLDTSMDPELLEMAYARAVRNRERLRASAAWGDEPAIAEDADPQAKFLAILGRQA